VTSNSRQLMVLTTDALFSHYLQEGIPSPERKWNFLLIFASEEPATMKISFASIECHDHWSHYKSARFLHFCRIRDVALVMIGMFSTGWVVIHCPSVWAWGQDQSVTHSPLSVTHERQ